MIAADASPPFSTEIKTTLEMQSLSKLLTGEMRPIAEQNVYLLLLRNNFKKNLIIVSNNNFENYIELKQVEVKVMWANSLRVQKTCIFLLLSGISVVTWRYILLMDQAMNMNNMADAWMPPPSWQTWSTIDFINTFIMWIVMMAAMMLPSVIPMTFGFIRIYKQRNPEKSIYIGTQFFVLGYFLIWVVFCIAMTGLQWQLHKLNVLSPMMESRNVFFSALLLLLAGVYQITYFKSVCLDHCRKAHYLREDCHSSAIIMGLHHGLYCVGACWALMLIMFAVGVMNVIWMGLVTFILVLEKIIPFKPIWLCSISGFALVIWGGNLIVSPELMLRFDLLFL